MTNKLSVETKNWENQTHQEWIKRVKKELKLDDLSDKVLHIDKDVIYDPYKDYSVASFSLKINNFPRQSIGMIFNPKDELSFNDQIMKLLPYDLRVIRLELNKEMDWNAMMKGIHMNLITWIVDASDDIWHSFTDFVSNNHKNTSVLSTRNSDKGSNTISFSFIGADDYSSTEIINRLVNETRESSAENIYLEVKIGQSLLHTITFLRAARIAVEKNFADKKLIISAFPMVDLLESDVNQQIIMTGSVAMQSSMAGVDFLFPVSSSESTEIETKRLMLNVQNIMELESYTHKVEDPLSGSYVIDDITQQYLDTVG